MQHLPFILLADAGVNADDSAMAEIVSDRMTANFMAAPFSIQPDRPSG